jgi:hypothetical protein
VWSRVETHSCMGVGAQARDDGAGYTRFETVWASQADKAETGAYSGRIVVRIENARIELNAFSWQRMSRADGGALAHMYQAALWHELGHLRTAKASADAINVEPEFSAETPGAYTALARAHGNAAVARVNTEQANYDRAARHGIRQTALPAPLGGPNTVVMCSSGRG